LNFYFRAVEGDGRRNLATMGKELSFGLERGLEIDIVNGNSIHR